MIIHENGRHILHYFKSHLELFLETPLKTLKMSKKINTELLNYKFPENMPKFFTGATGCFEPNLQMVASALQQS